MPHPKAWTFQPRTKLRPTLQHWWEADTADVLSYTHHTSAPHLVVIDAASDRHGEEVRGHHTGLQVELHGCGELALRCLHTCTHTYTHTHTHTHKHTHIQASMQAHTYIHTRNQACKHTRTRTHVCAPTLTHTHTHTHTCVCTHTHTHIHTHISTQLWKWFSTGALEHMNQTIPKETKSFSICDKILPQRM